MAVQFSDFANIKQIMPNNSYLADLLPSVMEGYKMSQEPAKMAEEQRKLELANALSGIQNQFKPRQLEADISGKELSNEYQGYKNQIAPQTMEAELAKTLADAESKKFQNQLGLGSATGILGNELAVRHLEQTDHPDAAAARQALEFQKQQEQLKRHQSPAQRNLMALDSISKGINPNTGGKFENEDDKKYWQNVANRELVNTITDPTERQQAINLTNMVDTLDSIDVDALTDYSGVKRAEALIEQGKDLTGDLSPKYAKHKEQLKKLGVLVSQYRQGFGEAASQGSIKHIEDLLKPGKWESPELAKRSFNELKSLLKREANTKKRAILDTSVYYGENANNPYAVKEQSNSVSPIRMMKDGKIYSIPSDKAAAAESAGFRRA